MKKMLKLFCPIFLVFLLGITVKAEENQSSPIVLSESVISVQSGNSSSIDAISAEPIDAIVNDSNIANITIDNSKLVINGNAVGSTFAIVYFQSNPSVGVPITIQVTEGNQEYEYMAAEGYKYLLKRDASSLNPGTLNIVQFSKIYISDENSFVLFSKMASSGVAIEYSRVSDYGFTQNHTLILLKSIMRTSAFNQIIAPDGTYVTVIGLSGFFLNDASEFETLNTENVLNYAAGITDINWYVGEKDHKN